MSYKSIKFMLFPIGFKILLTKTHRLPENNK